MPIVNWADLINATGEPNLNGGPFNTFVVLNKTAKEEVLNKKIAGFLKQHIPQSTSTLFPDKYADAYLHGVYENGVLKGGRIAEQRVKEIGIRRTLGASRRAIVYLLWVDFTKTVAVAIVIGLPVSYLVADKWLNGFAYRITLTPLYFIAAAFITLFIAVLTIGIQTASASGVNPVETLKAT